MDILAQFLSMMTLVFGIASMIAGGFTAYFGSGKSRIVGGILIVIGLLVLVIFAWGAGWLGMLGTPVISFEGYILQGVVAILGAIVGAVVALGIFLLAIMKA